LANQDIQVIKPLTNHFRFTGKLFLLTDKTTASAAATFSGIFKEKNLGVIIGEETGGTIDYFGDYWELSTPNTEITFCISPKQFIQYGGTEFKRGVIPDHLVANTNDSIMKYANRLIEPNSK